MATPPASCVTQTVGKSLCEQWQTTRAQWIKNAEGYEDTCEFNMSLSDLQDYIDYVKAESMTQGIENPGVRVYFAAYSDGSQPKATLLLSPTVNGSAGAANNYTILPGNRQTGEIPPQAYNPPQ